MSNSVSVVIATRDRQADLTETLRQLRVCRPFVHEVIVIDDGSAQAVETAVNREWPGALIVRHETSAGQCQRRSESFVACSGMYVLQLDDDSAPLKPDMLVRAAELLE